jgi:hypothetical protein
LIWPRKAPTIQGGFPNNAANPVDRVGSAPRVATAPRLVSLRSDSMALVKGRIIKPETTFIDNAAIDLEETTGGGFRGQVELPVGASLKAGETYRMELHDGRAGTIRVTAFNDVSTKGIFEGVGPLS